MKIEKLPSGSYRVRTQSDGKRVSVTFPYKPSNEEAMIAITEKLKKDIVEDGTFLHYANQYVADRSNVISPSTIRSYNNIIKQISGTLKAKKLYSISQTDVQKEVNAYSQTHSPKSVRNLHGFIAAVMGQYRPSFTLSTTLPQKEVKEQYLPSKSDISKLLKRVKGTEDSVGIQLGILSCRRCEICALEMSDLKGNELTINKTLVYNDKKWTVKKSPKTDTSNRVIILPDSLVKEIKEQGYFFKYSPQKLNQHLQAYQKELGLPHFRFHDLRHYFASYAHSLKIPDADIMVMGGWKSDYVMKNVYRKAMEQDVKKNAVKLSKSIL